MLLQIIAVIAAVLGVTAAIASHNLKRPMKIPNFYSPHSYLGIFTLILLALQVGHLVNFSDGMSLWC